ncbi:hypothetical protein [Olivibacter domesticus]|uniref:TspO and MBR related proteins n=1 Tax=Olivibacter domesticus TaxID=407022 RepID=A0A1H7L245_OLID1|nr:hypothetical protein [Olivibacter domesticus]SEK92894.1 hypothetical protein SAMN05661044_01529 [Olivibacter domesticus]
MKRSAYKLLAAGNMVALLITFLINYLSNTGVFNGTTIANISNRYKNLLTPADYAFSIWGLIYIGLFAFVIYQAWLFARPDRAPQEKAAMQVGIWFILSCIANCLWVLAWVYGYMGLSILIMVALLYALINIISNTNMERYTATLRETLLVWWPFSLYAGWISLALAVNIATYLTKSDWDGFGLSDRFWAMTLICIIGILNLLMIWKRNMREFATVGIWGLVAIAVANWSTEKFVVIFSLVVASFLLINNIIHARKNFKGFL